MSIYELFERFCKALGGALRKGVNRYGEEVLMCLVPPSRGVSAYTDDGHVYLNHVYMTIDLGGSFEIVANGDMVATLRRDSQFLTVLNPQIVSLNIDEKRVYIGSEKLLPDWAKIE